MPEELKRNVVYDKSFEAVRRKLNRAIADRDEGLLFDTEDLTLAEYLTQIAQEADEE